MTLDVSRFLEVASVHLLTRRRFDRVPWAAMQFLELEREARRRVRIEELQLILLRLMLVGLLEQTGFFQYAAIVAGRVDDDGAAAAGTNR